MRIFPVLTILFALIGSALALEKSHLGNLWIVTIDRSGSMIVQGTDKLKGKSYREKINSNRRKLGNFVHESFRELEDNNKMDILKDSFIFYYSGYVLWDEFKNKEKTYSDIEDEISWEDSFVKTFENVGSIRKFSYKDDLHSYIDKIVRISFEFQFSWTSMIKLISLTKTIQEINEPKFLDYNNIYIAVLSDYKDQNDQWSLDYKNLKMMEGSNIRWKESIEKFNTYDTNPFNNKSRQEGVFNEQMILTDSTEYWSFIVYSYETGFEKDTTDDSFIPFTSSVTDQNSIEIKAKSNYWDDRIEFVVLDSIKINGKESEFISELKTLVNDTLRINIPGKYTNNYSFCGYFQTVYFNPLLSSYRRRKIYFSSNFDMITPGVKKPIDLLKVSKNILFFLLLPLLALFLINKYFVWPYRELFSVILILKKDTPVIVRFRNGFKSQMKNKNNRINILSLCVNDNNNIEDFLALQSRFIKISKLKLNDSSTFEHKLYMVSRINLGVDLNDFIEIPKNRNVFKYRDDKILKTIGNDLKIKDPVVSKYCCKTNFFSLCRLKAKNVYALHDQNSTKLSFRIDKIHFDLVVNTIINGHKTTDLNQSMIFGSVVNYYSSIKQGTINTKEVEHIFVVNFLKDRIVWNAVKIGNEDLSTLNLVYSYEMILKTETVYSVNELVDDIDKLIEGSGVDTSKIRIAINRETEERILSFKIEQNVFMRYLLKQNEMGTKALLFNPFRDEKDFSRESAPGTYTLFSSMHKYYRNEYANFCNFSDQPFRINQNINSYRIEQDGSCLALVINNNFRVRMEEL